MDIEEDIKKVSERFNNGTETIEDILKYCRNFKFTFENGIKLQLVEKKYLDRLIKEYKNLLAEREEDKKKIEELEKENKRKDMFVKMAKEVIEESILKQKIKEKIKDLEYNSSLGFEETLEETYKIKILQELLEDK